MKQYIELYEQTRAMICEHSCEAMNAVRDAAFEAFRRQGFPTKKAERYKYTDIGELFAPDYGLNINRLKITVNPYDAFKCDVPNLSTSLYFVINDELMASQTAKEENGVIIGSLCEHQDIVERYYSKIANSDEDAITALNTMLAQDGLLVYVPKGVKVERPVQVINILKSPARTLDYMMVNRRVLIVAEENAEIKLLFCDHSADDSHFLTTQVVEGLCGRRCTC